MRIKRIIIFLTVVLLFFILSTTSFAADKTAILTVDSVKASPGDSLEVRINLKNNPGIISANINVAFDEGLTLIGATNGNTFPKSMSFIPPKQLSTVGKITGHCNFAWQGVDIADKDIKDGVILTLYFEITESARQGDVYEITVTSKNSDIVDKNLQCVKLRSSQGKVSINEDVSNPDNANTLCKSITEDIRVRVI